MSMLMDDTTKRIIESGNPELDDRLGGGLPVGSLVLIEGGSGSGKSVLTQQITWGSLHNGFKVALFTSENTVRSMMSQMDSIDLDILDFLLLGRVNVYPVEPARLGSEAPVVLLEAIKNESDRNVIVIDSLTSAISEDASDKQVLSFFEACKRICGTGVTIIVTLHGEAIDVTLMEMVRSKCDAHLQLRSEQDGQKLVKTLQVTKVRGAQSVTGSIVGFEVEPGWGVRVIPISKARG